MYNGRNMHIPNEKQLLAQGRSFWRIELTTGRTYSECTPVRGMDGMRPLDWYLDVVATGDVRRIAVLSLYSPAGPVALKISEPNTAYILNTNILNTITGNDPVAQAIGRVDDKETGVGIAFIWDCAIGQMYRDDQASVLHFAAWRPGIIPPGALNLNALGVKL